MYTRIQYAQHIQSNNNQNRYDTELLYRSFPQHYESNAVNLN